MIHEFFVNISHLNLLLFKYLTIINFAYYQWFDTPMYSVAYVQKGYMVSYLIDIWN